MQYNVAVVVQSEPPLKTLHWSVECLIHDASPMIREHHPGLVVVWICFQGITDAILLCIINTLDHRATICCQCIPRRNRELFLRLSPGLVRCVVGDLSQGLVRCVIGEP